jgi:hypothetical protein
MQPCASELLLKARRELEQVSQLLLRPSPEVLLACEQRLSKAASEMEAGRPLWKGLEADGQAAGEARAARHALQHVRRLLENAAQFYTGWQRIRAGLNGQYRPDGSLPELRCPARVLVRG